MNKKLCRQPNGKQGGQQRAKAARAIKNLRSSEQSDRMKNFETILSHLETNLLLGNHVQMVMNFTIWFCKEKVGNKCVFALFGQIENPNTPQF